MSDAINPAHYRQEKIQCIDVMRYIFGDIPVADFCVCNAFKYLWRFEDKNGDEDIDKAKWYIAELKRLLSENADDILADLPQNMHDVMLDAEYGIKK